MAAAAALERPFWSSALAVLAAHGRGATNTLIFELKPVPSPMQHELVRTPIEHRDGWVRPPDGPGLGSR